MWSQCRRTTLKSSQQPSDWALSGSHDITICWRSTWREAGVSQTLGANMRRQTADSQTPSGPRRPVWRWRRTLGGRPALAHPRIPPSPRGSLWARSPDRPSRSGRTCATRHQITSPRQWRSSPCGLRGGWCRRSPESGYHRGNGGQSAPVPLGHWPATGPRIYRLCPQWPWTWRWWRSRREVHLDIRRCRRAMRWWNTKSTSFSFDLRTLYPSHSCNTPQLFNSVDHSRSVAAYFVALASWHLSED